MAVALISADLSLQHFTLITETDVDRDRDSDRDGDRDGAEHADGHCT